MNRPRTAPRGTSGNSGKNSALVLWLSGLSGAGKSTIAEAVIDRLNGGGLRMISLDGDVIRDHRHRSLGFSEPDIIENNRLIAEQCRYCGPDYDVILVPVIAPLESGRDYARRIIGQQFRLIHCSADIATVRARDVKGLYGRADRGEISNMIGYSPGSVAYEPPANPDLVLDTAEQTIGACVDRLCAFIESRLARE